jgi:Domain of unknown function (DUF5710)
VPRIDLVVPFGEDEEARRHGAAWDSKRKAWFVPDGADGELFRRWRPDRVNVRSASYWIAQVPELCSKCGSPIHVFALIVPAGYEVLDIPEDIEEDEDPDDFWESMSDTAILSGIEYISPTVQARITALSPHYKRAPQNNGDRRWYWTNHCSACGVKQRDDELFHEPEDAFLPTEFHAARDIRLHRIDQPLRATAGYGEAESFAYLWRT